MAGRGPAPKPDSVRQRRNRNTTGATLPSQKSRRLEFKGKRGRRLPKALQLPAPLAGREWNPRTLDWWQEAITSPMATQWLDADRHSLILTFELIDEYYDQAAEPRGTKGRVSRLVMLAAEIRQEIARFGMTPRDRLSLHWAVAADEEDEAPRPGGTEPPANVSDFRGRGGMGGDAG